MLKNMRVFIAFRVFLYPETRYETCQGMKIIRIYKVTIILNMFMYLNAIF